jgi:tRNA pseudouridine55 synthase
VTTDGVLVVDKPAGVTSHDVVDQVRNRLSARKVGHAGTLDPDATGILVLGLGRATRFLDYAQAEPKRYVAVASFGTVTTTQDASGDVVERRAPEFDRADLEAALRRFRGPIDQVPPMVSAVKVKGERLYARARRGETVERPARRVVIHELELRSFVPGVPSEATLEVECSAGTYVRTLVHDLGRNLGCGAHLVVLRRVAAGGFTVDDAVPLDRVSNDRIRPLLDVVARLPRLELSDREAALVRDGRPFANTARLAPGEITAVVRGDRLLGVYRASGESLIAERVVAW